ncbi:unnamed protein product, partial [Mesorhabditis belari]|uniref:Uncharacterized protein n=1 Tax=Mesorhabditis belari TaxID=2138241 RepID=A0AAF3J2U5_9BILA
MGNLKSSTIAYAAGKNFKTGIIHPVVSGMVQASKNKVGAWLLICAAGCYMGVSMGGLTRLNEAAMKMTDRHPFTWIPPFGHWDEEFEKYKKFDEYKMLPTEERQELTLNEFIFRWLLVYFHRIGGRMLFFVFFIPCGVFWYKGYFTSLLKRRMFMAGLLMFLQIPLGWYMLNSGLHRELMANKKKPGVSQYRMAFHLIDPFLMFGIFFYNALSLLLQPQNHCNVAKIGNARLFGKILIGLLLVGSFMGSFLTALDAAEPEYARAWFPDDLWVLVPKWRNLFENPVTANFVHRYLGYATFAMINVTFFYSRRLCLLPRASLALKGIMALGYSQLFLGIITMYFRDPPVVAWLHQNFALHLFSAILWFAHEIRPLPL